jgi:hypothetical protein
VWRLPTSVTGNEMDVFSTVNISLSSSRDEETNLTNNNLMNGPIRIEFAAIADLTVSRV